jgi:hypothetical protein
MGSKPYARNKKPCGKKKNHTIGIKKPMLKIKYLVLRSFGKILF